MCPEKTLNRIALANRIKQALPELGVALNNARDGLSKARDPEAADFTTLIDGIKRAHQLLSSLVPDDSDEQAVVTLALVDIHRACRLAMHNTVAARIPESGDFGFVAQSLDWASNILKGEKDGRS